jgi:hypothetical protein
LAVGDAIAFEQRQFRPFGHTQNGADEWISLDFGDDLEITSVVLTNRNLAGERLDGAVVSLRDASGATVHTFDAITGATNSEVIQLDLTTAVTARSVYIDGEDGPPVSGMLSAALLFLYFLGGRDRAKTWDIHRNENQRC